MNLTTNDVKVFVPAMNFEASLRFYQALGWNANFVADDNGIAELELANYRFYLQNYYNKHWADNFMMHITVEDAQAWQQHASTVIAEERYENVRVEGPKEESYGALVTYVWDPSGVLLHFAQPIQG